LFFHPLGVRYFQSAALTTINETVANMVGQELASSLRSRFPLSGSPTEVRPSAPPPDRALNVDPVLHHLRLDVDALLAQGKVAEAERQMTAAHDFLAQHGYYLPDINQAYFAFYGSYGNTAASSSPLGPRLAELRSRYTSLRGFVQAVQNVKRPEDLSHLLQASGG
jgi:hypothetical protein